MESEVLKFWQGQKGKEYAGRNPQNPKEMDALYLKDYDITRSEMNQRFLGKLPRDIKILEVGCNIGVQLWMLHDMGFKHLVGIDVQPIKKASSCWAFKLAPAQAIPFKDKYFDLVFTSGLLIHIPPHELPRVMEEIYRVTNQYIFGFEYYAEHLTNIPYYGESDILWAGNYHELLRGRFLDLGFVDIESYQYRETEKRSVMYLLEKRERSLPHGDFSG